MLAHHPEVWLIADDIYEHILFDGARFATPAQLRPDLRDRILTVNGVSKSYAMTGWRIGYAAGPVPLIRAMSALQSHSTHCACSVAQAAAASALAGPQDVVTRNLAEYAARRDLVLEALRAMPGLTCAVPGGAFYAFIGWEAWQGATTPGGAMLYDDEAFCSYLLHEAGLAVVPGAAFGAPGHARISFASDRAVLAEGMRRLRAGVGALGRGTE